MSAFFLRQVYAVLFCWLALSSQPFSMALNTHVTFTSSGKRSLRSVVAHRLSTANPMEKVQQSFSTWRIGMNLASVCRENCDELIEDVKSQGEAFLNEAMLIDTITDPEPFLDGIESVITTSLKRSGMTVPETLRTSLDSIIHHGHSSPPLAPVFRTQLARVWAKFETSEVYESIKSMESSAEKPKRDGQTLHNMLLRLVSRIAKLDERKVPKDHIEKPHEVPAEVDREDAGASDIFSSPSGVHEEEDVEARDVEEDVEQDVEEDVEAADEMVTGAPELEQDIETERLSHNNKKKKQKQLQEKDMLQLTGGEELLLLQLETKSKTKTTVLLSFLLDILIYLGDAYLENLGPVYGCLGLLLFAVFMDYVNGASEPTRVVTRVQAQLEIEQDEEEEEDEDTKDAPRCSVCWAKPVSVYSPTCRHYTMCSECAKKVKHCPICRAPLGENLMQSLPWPKYKEIQSLYVNGKEDADL